MKAQAAKANYTSSIEKKHAAGVKSATRKRTRKSSPRKKRSNRGRALNMLWLALIFIAVAALSGACYYWWLHSKQPVDKESNRLESYQSPKYKYEGLVEDHTQFGKTKKVYTDLLHDLNDTHLEAATQYGIPPCEDSLAVIKAWEDRKLIKVEHGDRFDTSVCTFPYLVPDAYDILLKISDLYRAKMGADKRLRVTSCMRSEAFVRRLTGQDPDKSERINIASKKSAHRFGTTFDISYAKMTDAEKQALAQVLKSLRDAGYLHVLYEYSQPCFHSTIARPGAR